MCVRASVRKRGGEVRLSLRPGIAVNDDQALNPVRPGRLWMMDAGPFGASGGTKAGLKPSLAL